MKRIEDLTHSSEWQKKLQAALKEAQTGRGTFYGSGEEFMKALERDFAKPKRLHEAGDILGIKVLDHIVLGADHYYSFKDEGEL